jgi:D-3-phosphoglycerate dehydrogenase
VLRVVVAGVSFPSLDPERQVLARVGAEVVEARGTVEALTLARGADALLTDYFPVTADVVAEIRGCRVVCQYGVGLDGIDIEAATAAGIVVTHTPSYCVDELADHTLALLLAVARKVALYDRSVRKGDWDYNIGPPMRSLRGRTLGLVGFGRAARALVQRTSPLGLRSLAYDPLIAAAEIASAGAEPATLARVLAESDIVSLHAPLTSDTHGLLGAAELAAMKPGSIVVNTARGGLVDEQALAVALGEGRLAGAGLDVLATEPPSADHPLLALDNVVLTPHAAFLSVESLDRVQREAAEEVARVLIGEQPRHAVNEAALRGAARGAR